MASLRPLLAVALLALCPTARAQDVLRDTTTVVSAPPVTAPPDSTSAQTNAPGTAARPPDAAEVLRKTVLALRIRFLVENWPVSDAERRLAPAESTGTSTTRPTQIAADPQSQMQPLPPPTLNGSIAVAVMATDSLGQCVVRLALFGRTDESTCPLGTNWIPSEDQLRTVHDRLAGNFPRLAAPAAAPAITAGIRDDFGNVTYSVFRPAGFEQAQDAAAGAGVSFQQALVEGATAFLLDRARADLARAGLEEIEKRVRESPLRDAFPQTLALSGFEDENAYRDPRLYLRAFQTALVADFDGLPGYITTRLEGTGARGLSTYEWAVAGRSLGLVADVQRGTHPLLALSTFARDARDCALPCTADPRLTARLFELDVLASALYAGSAGDGAQAYDARRLLDTVDGRRLFATFLREEIRTNADRGTVEKIEARIVVLRQTLGEVVREVETLRASFAQIRTANPEQAATVYADYIAVVTRAVRQVLVAAGDGAATGSMADALTEVERVLSIRTAVVRRDYPAAVGLAMPYLTLLAGRVGGPEGIEAALDFGGALALFASDHPTEEQAVRGIAQARIALDRVARGAGAAQALSETWHARIRSLQSRLPAMSRSGLNSWVTSADAAHAAWKDTHGRIEAAQTIAVGSYTPPGAMAEPLRTALTTAIASSALALDAERRFVIETHRTLRALRADPAVRREAEALLESAVEIARAQAGESSVAELFVTAATLASSATSEDVYRMLVTYAAPPGTYKARRNVVGEQGARVHYAVSAYVGVIGGRENSSGAWSPHAGLFMPVGVELTYRPRWAPNRIGYIGLLVSPVNLGTYADFRLRGGADVPAAPQGDEVENDPAYSFSQVLTPSAYVTLGLSRSFPATAGVGWSYVPELRETAAGTASARRFSAFLAVDIPLWVW